MAVTRRPYKLTTKSARARHVRALAKTTKGGSGKIRGRRSYKMRV